MRLFVALVCVTLVALSSGQVSIRGRSLRSGQMKLAVEPPTLLVKNAGIVPPTLLVKNAGIVPAVQLDEAVATPAILPQVSVGKRRIGYPYYPRYWPDYGSDGWYPGGWNSGPRYWDNSWYNYQSPPFLPRRRLVKPVVAPVDSSSSSGSSSTTTTTTSVVSEDTPTVDATLSAAVVPDVVAVPDVLPVADVVPVPIP
ncbi:hypothetical protein KR059_005548, partial [Drosophila kikkawai]